MSNDTQSATFLAIQDAAAMSDISFYAAIPSFLASIPVVYVLRHHWKYYICFTCRRHTAHMAHTELPHPTPNNTGSSSVTSEQVAGTHVTPNCHLSCCGSNRAAPTTTSDVVLSIILCLQTSDLIFAFGYLLNPFNVNNYVCMVQGILLQFSATCSMLFSMCLSFELLSVIKGILQGSTASSAQTGRGRLLIYSLLAVVVSIAFLIGDFCVSGFGRSRASNPKMIAWCWVKTEGDFSFLSFYGVAICVNVAVIVCYGLVLYEILMKYKDIQHVGIRKSLRKSFLKVGVYPILLLFTLLPGLIHRLPSLSDHHESNVEYIRAKSTIKYWHAATMVRLAGEFEMYCCFVCSLFICFFLMF